MARGMDLPRPHDLTQGHAVGLLDQDVHMVQHDAPLEEQVALPVEEEQRILDQLGDLGSPQIARSTPGLGLSQDLLIF